MTNNTTTPVLCVACDAVATHFLEANAADDPHCDACFDKAYVECGGCGARVLPSDLGEVQTCSASMSGPAEYDEVCVNCYSGRPTEDDRSLDEFPSQDWR
jgi:hypothetical protein